MAISIGFSLMMVLIFSFTSAAGIIIEEEKFAADAEAEVEVETSTTTNLTDFNFAAVGDWGCTPNTINTINNILGKNPELVLGLGDYSYDNATADCWFKIVDPIGAKMKIAIGNHDDVSSPLLYQYMNHFNLTKQYYSFNYKNVHFLVISTEIPYYVGSEQYYFVVSDLEKSRSDPNTDWIVVYYHNPAYSSPSTHLPETTVRITYHPLFDKYGVDLILQGHNHNYERSYPIKYNSSNILNPIITYSNTDNFNDPEGQIFATVGTGGESLYNFKGKAPYIHTQYVGFGFLNIDLINSGSILQGKFYANDGTMKDQFAITKSIN
jgi:hypothetical protein